MSASLVGSEMCIRDSCNDWSLASAATRSAKPAPSHCSHLSHQCQSRSSSCRLYTSDAADDM
eukprot:6464984-Alexandrium_andersonii.AAC.1